MNARLRQGYAGIHGEARTQRPKGQTARRVILHLFSGLIASLFVLATAHASGGGEAGGHEGLNWINLFWRTVNFIALAVVCYWLLARKVKEFFSARRAGIGTALAKAVAARETAQAQFEEYAAKLDRATGEIAQIGEMIRSQGLAEKARIVDDARKAAEKMKEDTQARMEQEFNTAVRQLRVEAVRLSTEMAEGLLRKHIRPTDHEAMVNEYIEKVVNKN